MSTDQVRRKDRDETVASINEFKSDLLRIQANITDLLVMKDGEGVYNYALNLALSDLLEIATNILISNAIKACEKSGEYNHPFFITPLISAIRKPETFMFVNEGKGNLRVNIDLDRTAGTLEEYANAVNEARKVIKEKVLDNYKKKNNRDFPNIPPNPRASDMWREKIYGADREGKTVHRRVYDRSTRSYSYKDATHKFKGLYWKTVKTRQSFFVRPAPWWRLLDKGNSVGIGTTTEAGEGKPYPKIKATNFVNKSITEIKATYRTKLREYLGEAKNSLNNSINLFKRRKEVISREITKLEERLRYIDMRLSSINYPQREVSAKVKVSTTIMSRYGITDISEVDQRKLDSLIDQLAAGISPNITGRVRLGRLANGKEVRIRVKQLLKDLDKEISK